MKNSISIKWLVLRHGVEKYLAKNFEIFVPSSAGSAKILGFHTKICINLVFPLLSKLLSVYSSGKEIQSAEYLCKMKKKLNEANKIKFYFNKYKSDKSLNHNYHLVYGALFPDTNKVKKILEIGLGTNNEKLISNMGKNGSPGASVRAFRDFFKNASIFGADIDKKILFKENRIKTFHVDQTNINSLEKLYKKTKNNFDLIIDDGLHAPYTNLNFIITGITKIKKGAWLIVEDIPFKTKPIWEIISFIINTKQKSFLIKTKNCYVFLINRIS